MNNPTISVVIPAYNYAHTLTRAIESVLPQLGVKHELIVINDGSTDNTQQVIDDLLHKNSSQFRTILKQNGGLSSVRNRGIKEARGDYLIFLDADDQMAPGALETITRHIIENPYTRMIIGGHWSIQSQGNKRLHIPGALPKTSLERLRDYLIDKRISLPNGACAMHRVVFEHGGYPEHFRSAEDIPVFAQALANYQCSVLTEPLALIYKHDDSMRHQFSHAKAGGLDLVGEVFSPSRLGPAFQGLKSEFYVQRCLSLFRSAYLAGDVPTAKFFWGEAFKRDWSVLLKTSYVKKAVRLWLGMRP